jgi:uncharacterized RDD family membrane protein YckC
MLVDDRVTIPTPEGVDVELVLAGLGSRFLARVIDLLIQAVIIIALFIVVAVSGSNNGWVDASVTIFVFLVIFVYDVLFEVLASGRTPGKRAAGIRVVGLRGEPIGFLASAIRNVVRVFELVFLYLPAIVSILVTDRNQRLGDLAAGTMVVREKFGGRAPTTIEQGAIAPLSVRADAVATWDVSAITPAEVTVVRQFLDRRTALPWHIRSYLSAELLQRIGPRLTGAPADAHPEFLLEGIVVAKQSRGR